MKAKLALVTLAGWTVCTLALAQNEAVTNPPAADSAAPAALTTPAAPVPETSTPTVAALPAEATIPLIQFQDVPLTTAIDNLARQASINYILDPKVGYGQPDERGQIKAQPNISIRWENLTAAQALNALITTYGLQLVDDPKTKIARVTIKDPAAAEPLQTKVIQLKYASPSNVVSVASTVLVDKRSKVIADVRTSQLVVSATEKEIEAVDKLVTSLDTRTKQVLIEAKILETTLNPKTAKGVDWSGTLLNQNVQFGNNGNADGTLNNPGVTVNDLAGAFAFNPAAAFLTADGVSAAVSFLNQSGDTKVVSEPRLVTLDNQKAKIDVGLLYPIVNTTAGTANTTGGSEITYSNLTVILDVTPRIAANNYIELNVVQNITRLGTKVASIINGENNLVDSFLARMLNTTVLIPSGNTLVMGGLIQDENSARSIKVPVLGELPYLGLLFRYDSKELIRQNLTIFITPTVVEETDFQPTVSTYLKTKPDQDITEGWSWWDSGKPGVDWSKKKETPQYSE